VHASQRPRHRRGPASDWAKQRHQITTAIELTNTHSVGVVRDALVAAQVRERGDGLYWSLPAALILLILAVFRVDPLVGLLVGWFIGQPQRGSSGSARRRLVRRR
jgi:hypothetical protein